MKTKVPKSDEQLQTKLISSSWNTYICKASIWTAEAEAKWSIIKVDSNWNTTYPVLNWVPVYSFSFLPADATTLTYSYN